MIRLNPHAKAAVKMAQAVEQSRLRKKEELINKKRGVSVFLEDELCSLFTWYLRVRFMHPTDWLSC